MSNLPVLAHAQSLVVSQQKEMLEVFTDFESANRYTIYDGNGTPALYAAEQSSGAMAFITRSFLKTKRPFTMQIADTAGTTVLTLRRPWNWFFSELHVMDASGRKVGWIDQRFAFLHKRFSVYGENGQELAEIKGPLWRPWTFRFLQGDQEIGAIRKQWSGLLKEAFTDADNFGLELGPAMDANLRTLALAATFLIDFLYFEDKGG